MSMFQSRNRETFDSNNRTKRAGFPLLFPFQSRNRETFDSNEAAKVTDTGAYD